MAITFIHAVVLILTVAMSFLIPKTGLIAYDLQISAALFVLLFISKRLLNHSSRLLESMVFSLVVLLVINSTGGTASPFFFLIYFLLFSLALLLEPVIAITTTLSLIIFYLISLPVGQDIKNLLPVFSLAFITPFAMFLGEEYRKNIKLQKNLSSNEEQTFLFLSLILKNHLKSVKHAVDNFMGDQELHKIKDHTKKMEILIENFEKGNK